VSFPKRGDGALIEILRAGSACEGLDARAAFRCAEAHGLAGVLLEHWRKTGHALPATLAAELDAREAARALDHAAHLALLARIDAALDEANIVGVALKGALFAERFYSTPSSRATSDVDLLVRECDLDTAVAALKRVGYVSADGPEEARFRREHHHLHLNHEAALPLELHFHAYRGFGRILRSEPLLERRRQVHDRLLRAIFVLAPEDELVYLAVHAAAHRFVRLGWLFDLRLLVEVMTDDEIGRAAERAREWGFARPVAFAAGLLVDVLGVRASRLEPIRELGRVRSSVARRVVSEPANALSRSATRFIYTLALCDSPSAALRYAVASSTAHVRRATNHFA
jgi:hypothetical protein